MSALLVTVDPPAGRTDVDADGEIAEDVPTRTETVDPGVWSVVVP